MIEPLTPEETALLKALEAELRRPELPPVWSLAERVLQNDNNRRKEAIKLRRIR
jgi:hypothetical protein